MSLFEVILVLIFPHSDWIRRDTEYLSAFSPNARKYGPEQFRIGTLFAQWALAHFLTLQWILGTKGLTLNLYCIIIFAYILAVGIKCFVGEYIGVSLPVAIPNLVKPKSKNCSSMYNSCFTITMNKTFDLKIYTKDLELRMGICGNDVGGCQVNCTKYTSSNCEVSKY